MNILLLAFSILCATSISFAASDAAKDIMTKNESARKVQDFKAEAKLSIGGGDSEKTEKTFTFWRKIQADNVHNNTLVRFHTPAEVRDEGILITENSSGKNDVLMYLPAFKKIRRVESQQQSGSFMGSVFSYSDIATAHVEDFTYKSLGNEKCPAINSTNKILMCFKIECTPASNEVKERSGYSRSVVLVRPDNFMLERAEYYQDAKLWKVLTASQIKMIDPAKKKWLAHKLNIVNQMTHEYTDLEFSTVKANAGIQDAMFTQQNLEKVK